MTHEADTDTQLKPAQMRDIAKMVLVDPRKRLALLKQLTINELTLISDKLSEVLAQKIKAAEEADRIRLENEKLVNNAITQAMDVLKRQGLKFSESEVLNVLSNKITPPKNTSNAVNTRQQVTSPPSLTKPVNPMRLPDERIPEQR